jgi:hypothetical protein
MNNFTKEIADFCEDKIKEFKRDRNNVKDIDSMEYACFDASYMAYLDILIFIQDKIKNK